MSWGGRRIKRHRRRDERSAGQRNNAAVCTRFRVPVETGTLPCERLDGSEWLFRYRLVMN